MQQVKYFDGKNFVKGSEDQRTDFLNAEYDKKEIQKGLKIVLLDRFTTATKAANFKIKFTNAIEHTPGAFSGEMILMEHDGMDYGLSEEESEDALEAYTNDIKIFDKKFLATHSISNVLIKEFNGDARAIIEEMDLPNQDDLREEYYTARTIFDVEFLSLHHIPEVMWGIDICYDAARELTSKDDNLQDNINILEAIGVNTDFNPASLKF